MPCFDPTDKSGKKDMDNKNNDISPEELLRKLRENLEAVAEPSEKLSFDMPDEPEAMFSDETDTDEKENMLRLRRASREQRSEIPDPTEKAADIDDAAEQELPTVEEAFEDKDLPTIEDAFTEEAPPTLEEAFAVEEPLSVVEEAFANEEPTYIEEDEALPAPDAFFPEADTPTDDASFAQYADEEEYYASAEELGEGLSVQMPAEPDISGKFAAQTAEFEPAHIPDGQPATDEMGYDAIEADYPDDISPELDSVDVDAVALKYLSPEEIDANESESDADELAKHISDAVEYVASIENQKSMEEPKEPKTETEKVVSDLDFNEINADASASETIDEVDVNLMIAFGMQDELQQTLGAETVKVVEEALDKDAEAVEEAKSENFSTELPDDMEFISPAQIKDVFKVYRRRQRNIFIRMLGAVLAAVAIFIFEYSTSVGGRLPAWLDPTMFPVVHSMISLELLLICLAFVSKPLFDGLKGIFTFKPRTNGVLALASLISVAYHVGVYFLYDGSKTLFCNFPIAVCVLLELVSEFLSLRRDIYSFNVVSSKRIKYVIKEVPEEKAELERREFEDYADEDSPIFGIDKTRFVDGFFRRSRRSDKAIGALRALLPLPVAMAVFFFIFEGVVANDSSIYNGLVTAYVAFMLAMPFSSVIAFNHPFFRASKIAYENGGAIVGEESLEEYSSAAAISFEDKDVFPSGKVKIRSIKVYGNNRIDRVVYNLASLFIYLGGPLADVLRIATKGLQCSDDIEVVDIAEDGIDAVVAGKHIFYGKADFLSRNNIAPIYDYEDDYGATQNYAVTYLVCNDEIAAKLYISYSIDPDFADIVRQLYNAGVCLGIKTFDPAISNELLARSVDIEKYPVKVLRCRSVADISTTEDNRDSGIVSKKGTKSLLKTLSLCSSVSRASKTGTFVSVLGTLVSFVLMAFILVKSSLGSGYTGFQVALYQLFWMIPAWLTSRISISK